MYKIMLAWENISVATAVYWAFLGRFISHAENVTCFFSPNMMFSHNTYVETLARMQR